MNQIDRPARCAAVHDLSGLGRCSLSVILPAMSVMGVQVCPLPTAVLSTHTGGFTDIYAVDLTEQAADFHRNCNLTIGRNFCKVHKNILSILEI